MRIFAGKRIRFEKSFERFGGYQMLTYLCKKKVMEKYFLSVGAKPFREKKSELIEDVIPKEPVIGNLRDYSDFVYKNSLIVYDQKLKEFHAYKDSDWVNDPFIDLDLEPLSKRYPFYSDKKDITEEELKKEVEKIVQNNSILPENRPLSFDFNLFGIDGLLPPNPKIEYPDSFWVKSYQCPDKRIHMEQYEGREYPFIHTTDVGEEVLLIPDEDNYFYLYSDFKHEQRFEEKGGGIMVDKECHPFFKLYPTFAEYGDHIKEFESSRLKRLLSDDYIGIWNGSEFDVYPKSLVWEKSDYMPAAWVPNQDWVTNIFKRKK